MKIISRAFLYIIILFACSTINSNARQKTNSGILNPVTPSAVKIGGYAGQKIDLCFTDRIKKENIENLIEPFRHKTETRLWQSEFWGKWMLSAVAAWKYKQDPELMETMKSAVDGLLETQLDNGYIGNYAPDSQCTQWDIWGRKYVMLGLIRYFEITNDKKALDAAKRVADHLLTQVGPGKKDITFTGNYHGMASSSVLEPIVYLYNHTSDKRYLDFAEYIVQQWNTEDGPKLIEKALEGIPVSERFPHPEVWWSWENGHKAYEMMSCYEGLLQLYLVTKKPDYLNTVIAVVNNIIETEINVAGSGSAFECWYHGIEHQTQPTYHTMETCVTMTWMKICNSLLQVTGNSKYADQVEKTFYNALLASMKFDAGAIAKYSPLEGRRHSGENQCGMEINCCSANGPRGFMLIPAFAYLQNSNQVFVNFYGESEANVELENGNEIQLQQITTYPESDKIQLIVNPDNEGEFTLNLRIPEWSEITGISVNMEEYKGMNPGNYFSVSRKWKKGDKIEIQLDLRGRLHELNNFQAITRGPLVLTRDSRFIDGFVDETSVVANQNGIVNLTEVQAKPEHVWLAFTAPLILGTDLEGEYRQPVQISFCDFASAGNTWEEDSRYRVWLPQTLNVMKTKYSGY